MYKLDKTVSTTQTHEEAERKKIFAADVPLAERLRQAWYLTCMVYGIDPQNPPRMVKEITGMRKHQQ
jgi:predicted metal-binding protein